MDHPLLVFAVSFLGYLFRRGSGGLSVRGNGSLKLRSVKVLALFRQLRLHCKELNENLKAKEIIAPDHTFRVKCLRPASTFWQAVQKLQ